MKIFRIIGYIDGGPNDRGYTEGFIRAENKESAREQLGVTNGFIDFEEISIPKYIEMKEKAERDLSLFKLL